MNNSEKKSNNCDQCICKQTGINKIKENINTYLDEKITKNKKFIEICQKEKVDFYQEEIEIIILKNFKRKLNNGEFDEL